jgi:hypothetical protein
MAKIHIQNGWLDVRVSLLERVLLREKPARVPLAKIRSVDPHPPLLDLLLRWTDQSGVWLAGATPYEGYLVPASRNPNSTLGIQVEGQDLLYVELDDDEDTERMAARIKAACAALHPSPTAMIEVPVVQRGSVPEARVPAHPSEAARHKTVQPEESPAARRVSLAQPAPAANTRVRFQREDPNEDPEDDVRLRDPLMQGSLPPPPPAFDGEPRRQLAYRLDPERDLTRVGGWLVTLGGLGVLAGTTIVAAGLSPGLLAVGAGLACAVIGGLALARVAQYHH